MNAADIVKYPHYHHQYLPDEVDYEPGALTDAEIKELQAMDIRSRCPGGSGQYAGHHLGLRHRQGGRGIRSARRGVDWCTDSVAGR